MRLPLPGPIYKFGDFQLDAASFELERNGESIRLERKPLELLILLAASDGAVIARTEIARRLWDKEVFVDTEHGINTAVRKIRAALRDDPATPRFIQTVPKVGYRFLQSVSIISPTVAPVLTPHSPQPASLHTASPQNSATRTGWRTAGVLASSGALAALLIVAASLRTATQAPSSPKVEYEQLTDVNDSAVAPALSPDGRALAFIRGPEAFASTGPIFIKSLPDGEMRQISSDTRHKYGPEFSPDSSEVAYTVFDSDALATYTVPVSGGDPHLFRNNAAGLTWLDRSHLLFSEVRSGIHLGVVTGALNGEAKRDIYFPAHQRGMAHYAHASPDRRWLLVVEMDKSGGWGLCRLVSFANPAENRTVGPDGACTAAAWSPDARWMYFTAIVAGQSHLWRQSFPQGVPQQVTFGPAEEEGVAVEASGDAVISSVGTREHTLWIHDHSGERPLSSEGDVVAERSAPIFRDHDRSLYYLLHRRIGQKGAELWRCSPQTGRSQPVFPGFGMLDFDVSSDGRQIVFSALSDAGATEFWLGPADQTQTPVPLGIEGGNYPHFGPAGKIVFQMAEGKSNYLEQVALDGSQRSKVIPQPIAQFQGMSPARRWAMTVLSASPQSAHPVVDAIPFDNSAPRRICNTYCAPAWSPDGRFLVFPQFVGDRGTGKSIVVPVPPGEDLAGLLPGTVDSNPTFADSPGIQVLPREDLVPGEAPDHYAYVDTTVHRNLFRITFK